MAVSLDLIPRSLFLFNGRLVKSERLLHERAKVIMWETNYLQMKSYIEKVKEIQDELKWDPELFEADIRIEMDNDIVTLTGKVETENKKKAAEKVVGHIDGVKSVINKLEVTNFDHGKVPMEVPSANSGDPDDSLKLSGA
jgi:predicted RNA-binding protein with EMAP domain